MKVTVELKNDLCITGLAFSVFFWLHRQGSRASKPVSRNFAVSRPVSESEARKCAALGMTCLIQSHLKYLFKVSVNDPDRYPHLLSVKNCFIRGPAIQLTFTYVYVYYIHTIGAALTVQDL